MEGAIAVFGDDCGKTLTGAAPRGSSGPNVVRRGVRWRSVEVLVTVRDVIVMRKGVDLGVLIIVVV